MYAWLGWFLLLLAGLCCALIAAIAVKGWRSPLGPLRIAVKSWSLAFVGIASVWRTVLAMAAVIGSGAMLQWLFANWRIFSDESLVIAGVAWQGVMATAVAVLAILVHRFVIADVLAAKRFGADTLYYRGEALNRALQSRPKPVSIWFAAACVGFLVWALSLALNVLANALIYVAPQATHAAFPAIVQLVSPQLVRFAIYLIASFLAFLIVSLAALVRPALSLRALNPLVAGISAAATHAPALYVLLLMMLAPAVIVVSALQVAITTVASNAEGAPLLSACLFCLVTLFQTLAFEIATVLFMNRSMNHVSESAKNRLASTT